MNAQIDSQRLVISINSYPGQTIKQMAFFFCFRVDVRLVYLPIYLFIY